MHRSPFLRAGGVVLAVLCGAGLLAAGWAAFYPIRADSRELQYVIPKGTWARRHAGERVDVLPPQIRLRLGVKDVLVMRNGDDVPQMFGPVLMMPGQSFRLPFSTASTYSFACTAHVSGQLTVVVDPAPAAGWPRLKWRVESFFEGVPA
jgi:hypothetical protein